MKLLKIIKNTLQFAIDCGTDGIKLQLLHIIKNTELYNLYCKQPFKILSLDEYVDIVIKLIEKAPQTLLYIELQVTDQKRICLNLAGVLIKERF